MKAVAAIICFFIAVTASAQIYTASYIAPRLAGQITRSGEPLELSAYVCAVKRGSGFAVWGQWLRVETIDTAPPRVVFVRVIDQLPDSAKSDIDLSPAAASLLFPLNRGKARVHITPAP